MSELRALTAALRTFAARIASVEDCLVVLLRNSEQEADWRHEQRNKVHADGQQREEILRSLKQVEEFQGALWKYLGKLDERQEAADKTRHDDIKEVKDRLHALESDQPPEPEEVTQA